MFVRRSDWSVSSRKWKRLFVIDRRSSSDDSQSEEAAAAAAAHRRAGAVPCAKLSGRHEISVRLKQCDAVAGPKVRPAAFPFFFRAGRFLMAIVFLVERPQIELEVQLGSAVFFLSPRQLHSLNAIFSALMKPSVDVK